MSVLLPVKNIFFIEKENRKSDFQTGLVIELEDGRKFTHGQDGFIIPFEEFTDESEITKTPSQD